MNRMKLYRCCGLLTLGLSLLLPFIVHSAWLLWPSLVVLGATAGGIYTLGLIQIGQHFRGHDLVTANASALMLWGIGSLLGPLSGGVASSLGASGLPLLLVMAACLFMVSTLWLFRNKSTAQPMET